MEKEEATAFVIKELSKHHSRNEIIVQLCHQMSLNWSDAERFVADVETQNSRKIAVGQSPVILVIGVVVLLAGIGLVITSGMYFFDFAQAGVEGRVFMLQGAYYRGAALITGFAMIAGSIIGLWGSLSALWNE